MSDDLELHSGECAEHGHLDGMILSEDTLAVVLDENDKCEGYIYVPRHPTTNELPSVEINDDEILTPSGEMVVPVYRKQKKPK